MSQRGNVHTVVLGQRRKISYTPFSLRMLGGLADMIVGNVFFVDSGGGGADATGAGTFEQPFLTMDFAVGRCEANNGDVIFVKPGHTETIVAAGRLALDVAGITFVGLGQGRSRPLINFTTVTTADMDVDAANITLANFRISLVGVDALAAPIDVNAADFSLLGCEIECANATNQATLAVLTDANANRFWMEGCNVHGTNNAGMTAAVRLVGGAGHHIIGNDFIGAYTDGVGAIENLTTACTETFVGYNRINNLTAASTKAMVFVSTSTGQIYQNYMQILSGTAPITGAAMSWVGANYYAATIATAGTLI